jgi:hypothetical protein
MRAAWSFMAKLFQDIFEGSKGGMDNFFGSLTRVNMRG